MGQNVIESGNSSVLSFSNVPIQITGYDQATPTSIACGSYHNIILSKSLPRQEQPSLENQILTTYGLDGSGINSQGAMDKKDGKAGQMQQ